MTATPRPPRIVFARTRHEYPSYADFWALVEACRFSVCYIDQINLERNAIFVTTPWNGETEPAVRAARMVAGAKRQGKVIWWNLERPDTATKPFKTLMDEVLAVADRVWISDTTYAKLDGRMLLVPYGSHPDLGATPAERKIYDVAPYSYLWGRRANMVSSLERAGLRIAPPAWTPEDKQTTLSSSRIMLSLHQYEQPPRVIAPIRCSVAAAYRLPFVTEEIDGAPPQLAGEVDYMSVTPETLVERVVDLLRDPDRIDQLSWRLYRKLCIEHSFEACVEKAAWS